ncbi:heat shock cognate 70 kDa protein-like [Dorcoceras hygrometricum]|uniref:Heat shock cognate 70 kDa protein-like n=1 Tax=Dorcoceras hygrometricum TaxID=472368 RepID=A0A2Z7CMB8_9LAMI|nr:heat shock cognate 70 kDa protein-like [Dorcoceras hygrometricum]
MQSPVAREWMHCSLRLVHHLATGCISRAGSLSCASLSTVDCDDITADVIIADSRSCASCQRLILDFFQSAMLTSSLLLAASSSRHADIIIAESRFLFASIQQLISSFFALLIPDFYCSSSSSTLLQQTS